MIKYKNNFECKVDWKKLFNFVKIFYLHGNCEYRFTRLF